MGVAVSDFNVESIYNQILGHGDGDYLFSTENIFARLRLGVVVGDIPFNSITFVYNGEEIYINKYGAILHWPVGFCDTIGNLSEDILRSATKLRKEEKK
jgi:hypothetical protein